MGGHSPARWALVLLAVCGCATPLLREDGRIRDDDRGYSLADPAVSGSWTARPVQGAEVAFQGAEQASMSLLVRCVGDSAPERILARQLLIGLKARSIRRDAEVEVGAHRGWEQVVDAEDERGRLALKTVTLVAETCTFDFVLVSRDSLERVEPDFDAWWSSFRMHGNAVAGGP